MGELDEHFTTCGLPDGERKKKLLDLVDKIVMQIMNDTRDIVDAQIVTECINYCIGDIAVGHRKYPSVLIDNDQRQRLGANDWTGQRYEYKDFFDKFDNYFDTDIDDLIRG
jgi:hypothetical protein